MASVSALRASLLRSQRQLHTRLPTTLRLRSFGSTCPKHAARYVRFSPDPKTPLDWRKWDTGTRVVAGLTVLGGVYYVSHLEQVPETGRWRFMDVSPKYEAKLAEATRQQFMSEFSGRLLPPNHVLTHHVRRVVSRILEASELGTLHPASPSLNSPSSPRGMLDMLFDPDADPEQQQSGQREEHHQVEGDAVVPKKWTVLVVNSKETVNAMAGPGTVVVFTGILPVAKDEDGLAAVLAHEIGHVVARHVPERYSSSKVLLGIALLLESLGLDFGFARLLSTFLLELPNSRKHEYEADAIGLQLMAKACYDPRAAPEMFTRLGKLESAAGGGAVQFISTHPSSSNRVAYLEERLPEAYSIKAASPNCGSTGEALTAFQDAFGFGGGRRWS